MTAAAGRPDPDAADAAAGVTRVRGTTLLRAPMGLIGVIGATLALTTLLWGVWEDHQRTGAFWATLVVSSLVGAAGFVAAAGCFIEVGPDEVRDVVAWRTVHRVPRRRIAEALVARGVWRWFVVRLDDGTLVTLVGASPVQFPVHLLPQARDADVADLDTLLPDRTARTTD